MLFHFIYPLTKWVSIFNVFGYITFRAVFAFIITFLFCLLLFPVFIRKMKNWKASQIIRDDGPQSHQVKVGTPTMGGVIVIIGIVLSLLICGNFKNYYILIILACSIGFGLIGFLDDYLIFSKKS